MNKTLIKTMIAIWTMIVVILITLLIYGIATGKGVHDIFSIGKWNNGSLKIQKEEKVSIDNCEKIRLGFSSADIEVVTTEESTLRVVEEARGNLIGSEKFTLTKDGNTIEIKDGTNHSSFSILKFGFLDKRIKIFIPKIFDKDLEIKSSSGNITFNSDTNLNNISCIQSSGNFSGNGVITSKLISLKSSSGNINANNLEVKSYTISATSGNIEIKALSGSGNAKVTSGNIRIGYKEIGEESKVNTTSGNIELSVLKGISFEFDGKCTSGNINSNFDLSYKNKRKNQATAKIGESFYKKISAIATSGNIDIYQVQ